MRSVRTDLDHTVIRAVGFDGDGGGQPRTHIGSRGLDSYPDPLHPAQAFGLSSRTAIDYSAIARNLMQHPIESVDGHPLH
ncbi:hypothetical protein ACQP1G_19590 [Nocardia sp. CA-107356]|uniref:hypothetical protein n=1 Tax=Nocardia sp. CA-107356 TaxID=3239972 RepID=UPI003D9125AD